MYRLLRLVSAAGITGSALYAVADIADGKGAGAAWAAVTMASAVVLWFQARWYR